MHKSPIQRLVLTVGTVLLIVGGAGLPPSGPGQPAVAQARELAQVRGGGGGGGGGGHSGRSASAANAPSAARSQATHQSAAARPSSLGGGVNSAAAARPSAPSTSAQPNVSQPSAGAGAAASRPQASQQPARPQAPSVAQQPDRSQLPSVAQQPSSPRPDLPSVAQQPGQADRPQLPGGGEPSRPVPSVGAQRPQVLDAGGPGIADRPDAGGPEAIDRPDDGRPGIADRPDDGQPGIANRPDDGRPGIANRPDDGQPGIADRPDVGRPGIADRPYRDDAIGRLADNRPANINMNFNVTNSAFLIGVGWGHVIGDYQYFYGPTYGYPYDWYYNRHMLYPTYYVTYPYDPIGDCFTEYYLYEDMYYCYVGPDGATSDYIVVPLPPEYLVGIDPSYQYYYGPGYSYEDAWYDYRHLGFPALYSAYDYDPFGVCATYYYLYGESYYCFAGA